MINFVQKINVIPMMLNFKLELCRAHTPYTHCAIYRSTFVCMVEFFLVELNVHVGLVVGIPVMSAKKLLILSLPQI